MNYVVQPGDSLSKIARDKLGDITLWPDLARHNNIANPDLIYPGQVINLDIPKPVIIDITPKKATPVLNWFAGTVIAIVAIFTVKKIKDHYHADN